jgi:hypothetical protein
MPFINFIKSIKMTIERSVKKMLQSIWALFKKWFSVAEQSVKDNIHVAVVIVDNLKKFIDNPVGDFLLSVVDEKIPGNLTEKVKETLPKVLLALHIIDDCKDLEEEDALKCVSLRLQGLADETKDAVYHSLAVSLAKALSDGKLSFSDCIALVEWYYRTHVKK